MLRRLGSRKGFTMVETLVAVGILVILMGLATPAVLSIQKNLKMVELDNIARSIFVAAQNRMTALKSAGGLEDLGGVVMEQKPQDFPDETLSWQKGEYFYLTHTPKGEDEAGLSALIQDHAVESNVWENNFLVEFNRVTGQVYGVFYGEKAFTYQDLSRLPERTRTHRRAIPVGYYGGSAIQAPDLEKIDLGEVKVENTETLTLTITPAHPAELLYTVTVAGRASGAEVTYEDLGKLAASRPHISGTMADGYQVILDTLEQNLQFKELFPTFLPGEDLEITVTARQREGNARSPEKKVTTNSLFAAREEETVQVAYGRHLQNLEPTVSSVEETVTAGVQTEKINWSGYYQRTKFIPISNPNLLSYQGQDNEIRNLTIGAIQGIDGDDSGLFGHFTGETIHGVRLVNATIHGNAQYAGMLAGQAGTEGKAATISRCLAYAEADGKADDRFERACSLVIDNDVQGATVGGLVGKMRGTITDSAASIPRIKADRGLAGGLVGSISGSVSGSYANSGDLVGKTVGAFAGQATGRSTFANCYALGLLKGTSGETAGFCPAAAEYRACYSGATYYEDVLDIIGFAPAAMSKAQNCHYMPTGSQAPEETVGTAITDWTTVLKALQGGGQSIWLRGSGQATHPYYFPSDQVYPYPRLAANHHYGDWPTVEGEAILVYYEKYSDGSYGLDDGRNLQDLKDDMPILEDGYALLATQLRPVTVTFDGVPVATTRAKGQYFVINNMPYGLHLLPDQVLTCAPGKNFYHRVVFAQTDFYCNPHFARSALNKQAQQPQGYDYTAIVRTPRHLYNLGWNPSYWGMTLEQELDINCGIEYPHTVVGDYQTTGTEGGNIDRFRGTYRGNGKTITALTISVSDNNATAGMFGATQGATLSDIYLVDPSITGTLITGALVGQADNTTITNCRAYLSEEVGNYNKDSNYASVQTLETATTAVVGGLIGDGKNCTIKNSFAALRTRGTKNAGGFAGYLSGGEVTDCYAAGTVSANGVVGGFTGYASTLVRISGCYSAADVDGGAGSGGFVGKSNTAVLVKNYACGRVSAPEAVLEQVGGFYGFHVGFPPLQCQYLVQTGHNSGLTLAQPLVGTVAYSALQYTGSAQTSHPYAENLAGKQYPFAPAGDLPHYADWPLEMDQYAATLVYYERYATADPNNSYYGFYADTSVSTNANSTWSLNTLRAETCLEDGYAVLSEFELTSFAYDLDDESQREIKGTIAVSREDSDKSAKILLEGQTVSFMSGDYVKYVVRNAYIYRLPFDLQEVSRDAASSFYVRLSLTGTKTDDTIAFQDSGFYYCPHFARTAVNPILGETRVAQRPDNPTVVAVRSARQLNALGRYAYYWNNYNNVNFKPFTFQQETDISFSQYVTTYCGEEFIMCAPFNFYKETQSEKDNVKPYANRPIGMPAKYSSSSAQDTPGQFQCTYDGQGHRIIDYYVNADLQFVGLFGEIANGQLHNIVLCTSQIWGETDNYGKIINRWCNTTVNNAQLKHPGTGSLVGLIFSRYTTKELNNRGELVKTPRNVDYSLKNVDNCSVSGYTIRHEGKQVGKTAPYIAVGGLVGYNLGVVQNSSAVNASLSIAVNGSARFIGGLVGNNSGTVQNCYAAGDLSVTANDTGSNPTYLSGLIGICGDYIGGAEPANYKGENGKPNNPRVVENCYSYSTISGDVNSRHYAHSGITYFGQQKTSNAIGKIEIKNCYYLDGELGIKPIMQGVSPAQQRNDNASTYEQMTTSDFAKNLGQTFQPVSTPNCSYLSGSLTPAAEDYPFPAVVTRTGPVGKTQFIHYGDWPVVRNNVAGEFGFFQGFSRGVVTRIVGRGYLVDGAGKVINTNITSDDTVVPGEGVLLFRGIPDEELGNWTFVLEPTGTRDSLARIVQEYKDNGKQTEQYRPQNATDFIYYRFSGLATGQEILQLEYAAEDGTHIYQFPFTGNQSTGWFYPEDFGYSFIPNGGGQ